MNYRKILRYFSLLAFTLLYVSNTHAKITLDRGEHHTRTLVDNIFQTAHMNFKYEGCNSNFSGSDISLTTDASCKDAKSYFLENDDKTGKYTSISGTVGEVIINAKGDENCKTPTVKKSVRTTKSLNDIYKSFASKGCSPTHIVLRDSTAKKHRRYVKPTDTKKLCKLKDARVKKPGFLTDQFSMFNFRANVNGFKMGQSVDYSFDAQKGWCVKYVSSKKEPPCGDWATPLPVASRNKTTGDIEIHGLISLGSDGTASIQSTNFTIPNKDGSDFMEKIKNGEKSLTEQAMHSAIKAGSVKVDPKKGSLSYQTWTKRNGISRALVRSLDGQGNHQRSINLFPRNSFGIEATQLWCDKENCFTDVKRPPLAKYSCKDLEFDVENGGSGNVCYSCIGATPGRCAIRPEDVATIRKNIGENGNFGISKYGEYVTDSALDIGIYKKFAEMVNKPPKKGCLKGLAPDPLQNFAPSQEENSEDQPRYERAVSSDKEPAKSL